VGPDTEDACRAWPPGRKAIVDAGPPPRPRAKGETIVEPSVLSVPAAATVDRLADAWSCIADAEDDVCGRSARPGCYGSRNAASCRLTVALRHCITTDGKPRCPSLVLGAARVSSLDVKTNASHDFGPDAPAASRARPVFVWWYLFATALNIPARACVERRLRPAVGKRLLPCDSLMPGSRAFIGSVAFEYGRRVAQDVRPARAAQAHRDNMQSAIMRLRLQGGQPGTLQVHGGRQGCHHMRQGSAFLLLKATLQPDCACCWAGSGAYCTPAWQNVSGAALPAVRGRAALGPPGLSCHSPRPAGCTKAITRQHGMHCGCSGARQHPN
jgi:hypothetical protein